jgi:hypothetical protein
MAVRERASFLASKDCKVIDDRYIHFGTRASKADLGTWDTKLGYDSTNQMLALDCVRAAATSPSYAYGFYINGGSDQFFAHTGANKSRLVYIGGTRSTVVAGGDSNDMLLDMGYSNYAINTPAGHYARGIQVSMQNRGTGEIDSLNGIFSSVRQRGDGDAITSLFAIKADVITNVGAEVPSGEVSALHAEFQLETNCPAAGNETGGYGVIVIQKTDGRYTPLPVAGFALRNRGTSSCLGWTYGLDLLDSRARTALADIRLASADSDGIGGLILSGAGTDDTSIQADLTARGITAAHGSLYLSVVKGAGSAWSNKNGTWTICV